MLHARKVKMKPMDDAAEMGKLIQATANAQFEGKDLIMALHSYGVELRQELMKIPALAASKITPMHNKLEIEAIIMNAITTALETVGNNILES